MVFTLDNLSEFVGTNEFHKSDLCRDIKDPPMYGNKDDTC